MRTLLQSSGCGELVHILCITSLYVEGACYFFRASAEWPSEHLPCENAPPECFGIQAMIETQEIKERAAFAPGIAVPAGAAWSSRPVDPKRGVTILAIAVMLTKRAAAQATSIQPHVATDYQQRVL